MIKKLKKYISIIYYNIIKLLFGYGSFLYFIAKFEHISDAKLSGHRSWTDDYFLWCEYISKKSLGKKITLEKIRQDYFKQWHERLKKITEEMNERDMNGLID